MEIVQDEVRLKYPAYLSRDEWDSIKWDFKKQFGTNDKRPNNEIEESAINLVRLTPNSIYYTQIDGEGVIYYDRLHHVVNRTGVYIVVQKNWKDFGDCEHEAGMPYPNRDGTSGNEQEGICPDCGARVSFVMTMHIENPDGSTNSF